MPINPAPIGDRSCSGENTSVFELGNQSGQTGGIVQIKVGNEVVAYLSENRNIAGHGGQAALHGFHQREAKTFNI